jgi:hypothetical protein
LLGGAPAAKPDGSSAHRQRIQTTFFKSLSSSDAAAIVRGGGGVF